MKATKPNRFVCSSNLFLNFGRKETIQLIAKLGFTYVDLWACPPMCSHFDVLRENPVTVRKEFELNNLKVSSLSLFLTTHEEKIIGMEYAAELGADTVIFEPGPSPSWPKVMSNVYTRGERLIGKPGDSLEKFLDTSSPYIQKAEELGLKIALEVPHVATVVENLSDIERLLALCQSPVLYFTLAGPHLAIAEGNLMETVQRIADRIHVLYLWNVKKTYNSAKDRRNYGSCQEQLDMEGQINVLGAAEYLLQSEQGRDFVFISRGAEKFHDSQKLSAVIRKSLERVPSLLYDQLQINSKII